MVPLAASPGTLAITPDGERAYVVIPFADQVSAIDTASNKVVAAVPVGNIPSGSPSVRKEIRLRPKFWLCYRVRD